MCTTHEFSCNLWFINVHVLTKEKDKTIKDEFYLPSNDIKIIVGDMNAIIAFQHAIGAHNLQTTNDNDTRLSLFRGQ